MMLFCMCDNQPREGVSEGGVNSINRLNSPNDKSIDSVRCQRAAQCPIRYNQGCLSVSRKVRQGMKISGRSKQNKDGSSERMFAG